MHRSVSSLMMALAVKGISRWTHNITIGGGGTSSEQAGVPTVTIPDL